MMTRKELEREIDQHIGARLTARHTVRPSVASAEILKTHPNISGADAPWYQFCAGELVYDLVNAVARRHKGGPKPPDPQMVLKGFEQLQMAYTILRPHQEKNDAGDLVEVTEPEIVPTDELTNDELRGKVAELRGMGAGCYRHADELERYRQIRFP